MRPSVRALALTLVLTTLLSCGGDGTTDPEPSRVQNITLSQGAMTFSFLGQTVTVSATVLDQFAQVFNTSVTWSSSDNSVVSVSAGGVVTAVGNGSATVEATAGEKTVSATATVQQVATQVAALSGNGQTGAVGEALATSLTVQTQDAGGSAVSSTDVTFTVTGGGGAVSAGSVTSDSEGSASTDWTLGTKAGIQELTAAVAGSNAGWAVLTATATAGPAATLAKTSGDNQSGTVGVALLSPVVVTVQDDFGNGVSGKPVTFAVTGGGGSISPAQVTTGEDGTAQATWTMGSTLGSNTLSASSEGLPPVTFTANAEAAKADLVPSTPTTDPENPVSLQTIDVVSTVTNEGYLPTGSGFRVQLLVDGAEAASVNLAALAVGASAEARFTVGPLEGGSHTFQVVADADGAVDETNEGNNQAQTTKDVAASQRVTPGTPITGLSAQDSIPLLFTLELSPSETGTMTVNVSGGTGDADLYVHFGDRPANRDDYECQSGNPDNEEQCIFNGAEPGTYHILIFPWADFSGASLQVTTGGPVVPFDIEVVIIDHGTATQDAAFATAAQRWMDIITSDIPSQSFAAQPIQPNSCTEGQPLINDEVDDIRIYVRIDSIDGASGTLASAGPCVLRGLKHHPVIGVMTFDEVDMAALEAQGHMVDVVLHEMGHVLGFGTIWDPPRWDLLRDPSLPSSSGADTHFIGERAIEAFDELGGATTYTLGEKVPVANLADEGSSDSHWREAVLGPELMSPSLNTGVTNPLSKLTIASMGDIGYRVDMTQADPFSRSYRAPQREAENRPPVLFGNDIRQGRLVVVDAKGAVREIIRR